MFRVGQKVVCVNGEYSLLWEHRATQNRPIVNEIYTIRRIAEFDFRDGKAGALWLDEIRNPAHNWRNAGFVEIGFWIARFRPIVERKTDISIFTKMLTPEGVEA